MIEAPETRQRIDTLFPCCRALDARQRRDLLAAASLAQIPAGHPICDEGDRCGHLALVLTGVARVYKLAESGRDITLYRVSAGQSCILTASCILSASPFPAMAVCEEAAEAVLLPAPLVRQLTAACEPFRGYVFGLMAQRLGTLVAVLEDVAFRRLDQRLAAYLVQRASQSGTLLQATHQDIASDLGSSREAVSRLLKDFESRGLLQITRGALQLYQPEALGQLAAGG